MMVIKGSGGEGKSQIGAVLSALFGSNTKDGSIGKISENRFARADLEHILLCVDDDMRMEALRQDQLRQIHRHRAGQDGFGAQGQAELSGLDVRPGCWRSATATCRPSLTAAMVFTGGSWC